MPHLIERALHASPELIEAFARLIPQLNPSYPPPAPETLQAILQSDATELWIARAGPGGPILGALTLVIFQTPTKTHAWIEDVVVDEANRGQGIGAELSRAAIQRATERGAASVNLTSRPAREAANRLYLKLGFELRQSNLYRLKLK
jgi:ribosomal protein S18 acetylase RimI-like enzyme